MKPNKRFETDSLRRRFSPPSHAAQACRYTDLLTTANYHISDKIVDM